MDREREIDGDIEIARDRDRYAQIEIWREGDSRRDREIDSDRWRGGQQERQRDRQ